ncbi:MAG: hypothetical protein ACYTHM_08875 [Planctomycetota bacterium]
MGKSVIMSGRSAVWVVGLLLAAVPYCSAGDGKSPEKENPGPGRPHPMTFGEGNNEDPSVLQAKDGSVYVAWFSSRGGHPDIWVKRSAGKLEKATDPKAPDAIRWEEPIRVTEDTDGDFYPCLVQAGNGTFHMTWFHIDMKAKKFSLRVAKSQDGRKWSVPRKIFPEDEFDWVPTMTEAKDGSLWIAWCSGRRGRNKEILVIRSTDGGKTWDEPIRVTDDPRADDFPFIFVRKDGSFLLTWTRYDAAQGEYFRNKTSEILFATSPDGRTWTEPRVIGGTRDKAVDILSSVYGDPLREHLRIVWVSGRGGGAIVQVPLSGDPPAAGPLQTFLKDSLAGWSPRIIPTTIKETFLMVSTVRHDPKHPKECDIFYRFIRMK